MNTTLPLDLSPAALREFPLAEKLAFALDQDRSSLEPVQRYLLKCGMPPERAKRQVREYLKYMLLLGATNKGLAPSLDADLAWHAHILHTQNYHAWCDRHFGYLIHHVPDEPDAGPDTEEFLEEQARLAKLFYGDQSIY